jgi:23S rRNA pseudouridine1911/1915/1917 synthase
MLVVNKPSGMLVHPAGSEFVWAMVGLVRDLYPDHDIDLVHRLDRETSGAVLMTKDKKTNAVLKQEIKDRRVQKVYQAIVHGRPEWDVFDLHAAIDIDPNSELRIRRRVLEGGRAAHTTFRVLKRFEDLSLVECVLHTGRTHQIRVHLEHLEHPILGDKIYGQPNDTFLEYMQTGMTPELMQTLKFPRHALHAFQVDFQHPSGEKIQVRIPLWSDMMSVLQHGFVPDSLLELPPC